MTIQEITNQILGLLYEAWWKNYIIGLEERTIHQKINTDKNDISKAQEWLASEYLISNESNWFGWTITTSGIEYFEQLLPPSQTSKIQTQRELILKTLKEIYDKDTKATITSEELGKKINEEDRMLLLSQMKYLELKGIILWDLAIGGKFWARLSADGAKAFESYEIPTFDYMKNAYDQLFKLENHLRLFIQEKLKEQYGADWWEQGISAQLKTKADSRKSDETNVGWNVSNTSSNMEYLEFPDLGRIITNQWSLFEKTFSEQGKITHKLDELEVIRNAIAHNRNLSSEALTRLDMYFNEISNLSS